MEHLILFASQKFVRSVLAIAAMMLLATACAPQMSSNPTPATPMAVHTQAVTEATPTAIPAFSPPADTPTLRDIRLTPFSKSTLTSLEPVEQAVRDLASRLGVSQGSISVVRTYSDEFPASNLGCPGGKPDSRPIPAFVNGWVIELEYASQSYIYHADRSQAIYCGTE